MPQTRILPRSSDLAVTRQPAIQNGSVDLRSTSLPLHHFCLFPPCLSLLSIRYVSSPRNCPSYSHAASEKLKSVARVVQTGPPAPVQFGQHLVFGLDLLLQELDPLLFGLMVRAALAREGRSAILEELFLPTIEYRWLQSQFITQIGNRHFIQQVPPQDGNLLFSGVVLSLFSHASSPLS